MASATGSGRPITISATSCRIGQQRRGSKPLRLAVEMARCSASNRSGLCSARGRVGMRAEGGFASERLRPVRVASGVGGALRGCP